MTVLDDAKIHLMKAREYLEAADLAHDHELYNSAISNAVTSGINSKDAVCLKLVGSSGKAANHSNAVGELEAAGAMSRHASTTRRLAGLLEQLLLLKNRAQYEAFRFAHDDAELAINQAQELLDNAIKIVN
jgi:uncharacterized protein (UPF0332 family)